MKQTAKIIKTAGGKKWYFLLGNWMNSHTGREVGTGNLLLNAVGQMSNLPNHDSTADS